MACIQACGSSEAYHAQHKIVVNEMCEIAHNAVNKHCQDRGAKTGGCIKNNASGKCIKFLSKHDWSGKSKEAYPHSIAKCHSGTFVHVAHCEGQKDEAAVVYSDECGAGWLLAWSVKDNHCGSNKVYVSTGPIANYMNINWCDIKAKLDKSCNTSYIVDDCNGNEAFATITNGDKAALVATFNSYSC